MIRPTTSELAAVLVGGVAGTAARWGLDEALPHGVTEAPLSTLLVNVAGTFALAWFVGGAAPRLRHAWSRALVGPGFLGTFTTFSAVTVAVVAMSDAGRWGLAAGYLVASLVLGGAAVVAGSALAGRTR